MYNEIRMIDVSDLRKMCIEHSFYTKGSIDDYNNLFFKVMNIENITTLDIENIAVDIYIHSDTSDYLEDGYSSDDIIKLIMFYISKICVSCFSKID